MTPAISVLILTLNEEVNLPRCLESLAWSDDIVVLDSGSTDRTVEIARAAGARVVERKLDDWATHQNWAMESIDFRHPWVYYSDADEVVTSELRDEMMAIASTATTTDADEPVAYRVRFRNMFLGKWLRFSSLYPTWVLRFFRPERVRWERLVNPVPTVDGRVGHLRGHFIHYSFNKGLEAWFEKHNRYSTREAEETLASLANRAVDWVGLVSFSNANRRRRALKEFSFRVPFRPLLRFLYMFVLRGGFLDGRAGYHYCRMLAWYEYAIVMKAVEMRRRARGLPI